jgi:hypothetical protein
MQKLNPYFNNKQFSKKSKDKIPSNIKFSCETYIRINYAWAIKRILQFVRLYVRIIICILIFLKYFLTLLK